MHLSSIVTFSTICFLFKILVTNYQFIKLKAISLLQKEERASLEHFTHTDRKMDSQVDNLEKCSFDTQEEIVGDSRQIDSSKTMTVKTDRSDKKREERVTEVRKGQKEERREKVERREDKKTIRQSSVKSLTEKFIKSASK